MRFSETIGELFNQLNLILNTYIFDSYHALSDFLTRPLSLAITLYLVLMGYAILAGWTTWSFSVLLQSVLKLSLVTIGVLNWDVFSIYMLSLFKKFTDAIGSVLLGSSAIPGFGASLPSVNNSLQLAMIQFGQVGNGFWGEGSWHHPMPLLTALLVWGFGYALVFIAVFELVLAKVMSSVLLATAPFFIGFTLFKPTQGFFDRWIGALSGFALMTVFVSAILGLVLTLEKLFVAAVLVKKITNMSLLGIIPTLLICFISIGLIKSAAQLAQSIGGAVTTSSGNALLAGTIGGMTGSAFGAGKMAAHSLKTPAKALTNLGTRAGQRALSGSMQYAQAVIKAVKRRKN